MTNAAAGPLVLVAEDDPDIRDLMTRALRRAGYEIQAADDGTEALRLAQERPPALAVLDVTMPGMDGYELTRRLRAHPPTEAIPVILVTARARPEDERRGYEAGASAYVSKPFSPRELRDRVEALLTP